MNNRMAEGWMDGGGTEDGWRMDGRWIQDGWLDGGWMQGFRNVWSRMVPTTGGSPVEHVSGITDVDDFGSCESHFRLKEEFCWTVAGSAVVRRHNR